MRTLTSLDLVRLARIFVSLFERLSISIIMPFALHPAVPLGCVVRGATFYDRVVFKTSGLVVSILLLWCYPLSLTLRGKSTLLVAKRTAKRLSLLLLEITLPTITTSLIQVFVCDRFENESFLREQLTLACDSSGERLRFVVFAATALMVYLIGGTLPHQILHGRQRDQSSHSLIIYPCLYVARSVPSLTFAIMFKNRHAIQKLGTMLKHHNQSQRTGLDANQFARSKHARSSFVALTEDLNWLLPKFGKFKSDQWYFGVCLLVLRLLQTSFMAMVSIAPTAVHKEERELSIRVCGVVLSGAESVCAGNARELHHTYFYFVATRGIVTPWRPLLYL